MQESFVFYMSSGITIKESLTQGIGYGASEVFGPGLARASPFYSYWSRTKPWTSPNEGLC